MNGIKYFSPQGGASGGRISVADVTVRAVQWLAEGNRQT